MSKNSVMIPFFRTPFNYDRDEVSRETSFVAPADEESLAIQSAKAETDINTIVRDFGLTGQLPSNVNMPRSGDFTGVPDFQTALNMVKSAQEEFMKLSADVRARFGNDPGQFIEFCDNPANRDEAERLGLMKRPDPVPPPMRVEVVNPPSASS